MESTVFFFWVLSCTAILHISTYKLTEYTHNTTMYVHSVWRQIRDPTSGLYLRAVLTNAMSIYHMTLNILSHYINGHTIGDMVIISLTVTQYRLQAYRLYGNYQPNSYTIQTISLVLAHIITQALIHHTKILFTLLNTYKVTVTQPILRPSLTDPSRREIE